MTVQPLATPLLARSAFPTFEPRTPTITWHSFDLRSGRRGMRLHTAKMGSVSRIIGEHTDTSIDVRCYDPVLETSTIGLSTTAGMVVGWEAATEPGRALLVALDEHDQPVWGGVNMRRTSVTDAGNTGEWVTCQPASLEAYLDRRYVTDLAFSNVDQALIAQAVVESIDDGGIALTVDAPLSGTRRDRTYSDDEDKTVLSVLADLMAVENGLEFTVDLEWADADHTVMNKIVRFRERLGRDSDVTFWMPGNIASATLVEDYTPEFGANDVLATSSGQGRSRPTSDHQVDEDLLAAGWARYERRFSPSTSITRKSTLNAHASAELAIMRDGLTQLDVTLDHSTAPLPGRDWHLGDTLNLVLTSPRWPAYIDSDGRLRPGLETSSRCTGWTWDFDAGTVTPQLLEVG